MTEKPEIDVQRRRKGEKPQRRATAPVRRQTGQTTGSSGGTDGTTSGGGGGSLLGSAGSLLGGGKGKLGCGGIAIIVILILFFVFSNGLDLGETPVDDQQPYTFDEPAVLESTRTPRPSPPPSSGSGNSWLVMNYQDADDQVLEQDIFIDLNEMERIGSSPDVKIVTQIDRFRGGFSGDGDWRSTRRYLVLYDDDLNAIGSELVEDLGEINMADGDSLVDFVTWAVNTYPSDHYVLILSDHGMGWPGGWTDPAPGGQDSGSAPLIQQLPDDAIYLSELDRALADIQANTGIQKFDLIGMDACLMSQLEVYAALQPYADYAVASEETEPSLGWAYSAFLSLLVYDPTISTADLATNIVESYIDQDERITDENARMDFLRQNSSSGGFFGPARVSAEQLVSQLEKNITLTAVDLNQLPDLIETFNDFTYTMQDIDQSLVASARNYAQSYTSIFGNQVPPSFIDLGHFVQLVAKQSNDSRIRTAANNVLSSLQNVIVAERHGNSKPGSTGIAIYFPNSTLYRSPYTGMQSYIALADRFARVTLWDDFLVYHYNDRSFTVDAAEPVVPSTSGIIRAPGSGTISLSQITTTAASVTPGEAVKLSIDITGEQVGYVYFFTGLYDASSNSILIADTDYLESSETEDLNGVYYPVWPQSESFNMNFEWEPTLFSISDGSQTSVALFNPLAYGASAENAIYAVDGIYTFAESGEQRRAQMYFRDGRLFQVFGFQGNETASSPYEISTQPGDTFTLLQRWMELDSTGQITQIVLEEGDTLTFGSTAFVWEQVYAPAGDYLVGFLVNDLDGNVVQQYAQIKVE
jgi:hypothetical protein